MSPRKGPAPLDGSTTFLVLRPDDASPEDPVQYRCLACEDIVLAIDSDKHAISHRSSAIKVIWRQ